MALSPLENFQVSFKDKRVSTLTDMYMQIRSTLPVPEGSVIRVTFPEEIAIYASTIVKGTSTYSKIWGRSDQEVVISGAF